MSWRPYAALLSIAVFGTALLGRMRHDTTLVDDFFHYGNTLSTLDGSGYSWGRVHENLGHLELAILTGLFALVAARMAVRSRAVVLAAAAAFAGIYTDSLTMLASRVEGRLYVVLCDDALISLRYARNFAEGRGLVYNAGEYVDGFSNPLWTFFMIVPHAVGLHEGVTTIPVLALGGLLLLGAALLAYEVLDLEKVPVPVAVFAFFAIAFDASSLEFAFTGLETTALTFGSAAVVYGSYRKKEWLVGLGLVMLALSRADGAVVAVLLAAWRAREEQLETGDRWKVVLLRQARPLAAFAVAALGLVAWRMAVYGHPAPNTAYLKVFSLASRLKNGIPEYGERGLFMYGLPCAFVFLAPVVDDRVRRARRMLLPVLAVWGYSMYVGGDTFVFMRFLGPVTPLFWTSVALAVAPLWDRWERGSRIFALLTMALLVPVKSERGTLGLAFNRASWIDDCLVTAKTIEKNTPPSATIGTFYAGFAYYAPHRSFVDLLGKTESHIAHESVTHGLIPGHNKYDFDYVYTVRKPDVTLTATSCPEIERFLGRPLADRQQETSNAPPFHYQAPLDQLMDPTFVQLYVPHRVLLLREGRPAPHRLGCWFVREGAPVSTEWQLARQ